MRLIGSSLWLRGVETMWVWIEVSDRDENSLHYVPDSHDSMSLAMRNQLQPAKVHPHMNPLHSVLLTILPCLITEHMRVRTLRSTLKSTNTDADLDSTMSEESKNQPWSPPEGGRGGVPKHSLAALCIVPSLIWCIQIFIITAYQTM